MSSATITSFARPVSILILLAVGATFASAHISARISFDNGTGLLTAIVIRSLLTLSVLGLIALYYKQSLKLKWQFSLWQLLLGLLIAIQSICIYAAVSRIPVGIALLAMNTFPIQLALLSWALGGKAPTKMRALLMALVLVGLLLALDIPSLLNSGQSHIQLWLIGIGSSLLAAFAFAIGMWLTEHKLAGVAGSTRSFYTMLTVLLVSMIAGGTGIMPSGFTLPDNSAGYIGLGLLSLLYALAFTTLFMLAPRLNLAQNATAINIEPIASLILGWVILDQYLSTMQVVGGAVVISCIIAFSQLKK